MKLRISIVLISLLATFPGAARSQSPIAEVGLRLGRSSSTARAEYDCKDATGLCFVGTAPYRDREGFMAGAYARFVVWRFASLQVEGDYSQKGFEVTTPTMHVDYVELPILLHVDPLPNKILSPFAYIGVAPAIRAYCTVSIPNESGGCNHTGDEAGPAHSEIGWARGVGFRINFHKLSANLDYRATTSITNAGWWQGDDSQNDVESLSVGVSLLLYPHK